jgi:hypothetical protein
MSPYLLSVPLQGLLKGFDQQTSIVLQVRGGISSPALFSEALALTGAVAACVLHGCCLTVPARGREA